MQRSLLAALWLAFLPALGYAAEPSAKDVEFFEKKIRPVLVEHCYSCHSADAKKLKGGLALDTRASTLKGGDTGPTLLAGKPDQSLLIKAVRYKDDLQMPPKGKLSDTVIKDLERWVEIGAPDPREVGKTVASTIDWKTARAFWAFQPVHKPAVPAVKDTGWGKTEIDRFVLAALEKAQVRPVSPADKRTLLRRAALDLTGLPPTPEEVEAFLKDTTPDAFAKVVDRLLATPAYGERWGRYWLDVARYAEDQAHTFGVKPNTSAYRYRDWVIDAFNSDMPYDRFVKLQIAADLLDESDAGATHRAALGFFGLGAQYYKNTDAARAAADELDDRVDTLGRGFLGLTVSCARCHDHKFDPIPTQDYYSIAGIFQSSRLADLPMAARKDVEAFQKAQKAQQDAEAKLKEFNRTQKILLAEAEVGRLSTYLLATWQTRAGKQSLAELARLHTLQAGPLERLSKALEPGKKGLPTIEVVENWRKLGTKPENEAEVKKLATRFQEEVAAALAKQKSGKGASELVKALLSDTGLLAPADNELILRIDGETKATLTKLQGETERTRKAVPTAPPMVHGLSEANPTDMKVFVRGNPANQGEVAPRRFLRILSPSEEPARFSRGSGRLELAEAIANKDNPLTARVMVNRIWMHHFGRALVGTPSNFGALGDRPTNPELLDWLAASFMENGWSIKKLHRQIMLSAVYQTSSQTEARNMTVDPDNMLLWRMNRRRLDVEGWRDSLLAVSGQLDRQMGGMTLDLGSASNVRRTVYGRVSRHELNGLLRLFDFPDANITSEKRTETTVPQQQLFVLNSPFFINQAKALASRLARDEKDGAARIRKAYLLLYARPATEAEVQLATRYLTAKDDTTEASRNQLTRWERYTQALLATNEFLYID